MTPHNAVSVFSYLKVIQELGLLNAEEKIIF